MTTLNEIKKSDKIWLTPNDVAPFLQVAPYSINVQAQKDPKMLGFPVLVIGSRVKINRDLFVMYFTGELFKKEADKS